MPRSSEDHHEASDTEELSEQPLAPVGGIVPVSGEALNSVISNQLPGSFSVSRDFAPNRVETINRGG
jgi:hypothetical protein